MSTQLPGPLPEFYQYDLGETCIIFADDTSQAVHAFDINSGNWQVLLVPTQQDWIDAKADGNAAMIYNDSIVVGYSAITSTFSAITYTGAIAQLSGYEYGCIDNFAFIVTDQLFYVFDAGDAQWHSYSYTPPGAAPWEGGVIGKGDYIYLNLAITNSSPHTMVAYSLHTKTFAELTEPSIYYNKQWDHGFTFYRATSGAPPYLCGGYSAITGQFKLKTHSRYITEIFPSVYEELVSPEICNLFVTNELISGNTYKFYMWVFNTEIGDFAEYTFDYIYGGSSYSPVGNGCGGQAAYVVIRNGDDGDKLEFVVYSAVSNSFTHFDSPLFYWGFNSFSAGGLMIDGYDEQNYFLYDVQTQSMFSHPVQWTQGISPGINARGLANYWDVFAYTEQYEDTAHVFSYTRSDGSLYAFDLPGRASTSGYRGSELYGLLLLDLGTAVTTFLYSPAHNVWKEKDLVSATYHGVKGNYFYANYPNLNQTYFYDAQTNQEYSFTPAQQSSFLLAIDSLFFMYSADGKYISYSMHKHEANEYTISKYEGQQWAGFIVLNYNVNSGSLNEILVYDGYNNRYAPLTLTAEQGSRRASWPSGKTAFIATDNGYLFAYSPNNPIRIEEHQVFNEGMHYTLFQNYPNPFNPGTVISYRVPVSSKVILKVYDVLGRKVATLVNEEKTAGYYETEFKAKNLSSGLYFYQLKSGKFVQTKKMILLK